MCGSWYSFSHIHLLPFFCVKQITWTKVKKKLRSTIPPCVKDLTNPELQVLLRSVSEIWIGKVVEFFEQHEEIDGEDFVDFQDGDFSALVYQEAALQLQIKHTVERAAHRLMDIGLPTDAYMNR